ncbi:MAG: tellurite resistance TerB family protein [Nitratireductor sp.]|nr:tellurite resistance TerB family protein [Nitratireductor sp.]MCB1439589.1 tellurite resistance TerB family protein [Nitratireductor sp.]MCC0020881.1 tellurite resistance TerB family protein [Nitratireductor sp.]
MSLVGTLAKVAIGIAVAKGVGTILKQGSGGKAASDSDGGGIGGSGGLGDLLEQLGGGSTSTRPAPGGTSTGNSPTGSTGGLGDLLKQLGGGGSGGTGGGLGDLLNQLGGGGQGTTSSRQTSGGGALGDIFEQFTGNKSGGSATGGGLGLDQILGRLGQQAQQNPYQRDSGSLGDIFNDSFKRGGEPEMQPTHEEEAMAAIMLKAMIQAAKSDGRLDDSERQKLMKNLGDVSPAEQAFVETELRQPVDVDGLVRRVPRGMEEQVYMMSVMAIDLDTRAEAQYLHELASALGIDPRQANSIHDKLGVQRIYS